MAARNTVAADGVYLPNNPLTTELSRAFFNHAHKLMAQDSPIRIVTSRELYVGVADPSPEHAYERLTVEGLGNGDVLQAQPSILEPQCIHLLNLAPDQSLQQLNLTCVVQVVSSDAMNVLGVGPLRFRSPSPELRHRKLGHGFPQ